MSTDYIWPDPPKRARLVGRLRPGGDVDDVAVLEWQGEQFTTKRQPEKDELGQVPDDPDIFCTAGLFDVQINGYWGRGFKDVDLGPDGIRDLCWSIALSGSTYFLPTVTTDAPETMRAAVDNVAAACRAYPDVAAMVAGIHQEGPWISPLDGPRGAHPLAHVTPPSITEFERLQAASGNRITMLTVAPEVEGMLDFIREIADRNVVVCLGHHQADGPTIYQALQAGARSVTHLGNGCMPTMDRHHNVLWEQAAQDRLYASIIADGHHLPPAAAKVLYRAKPRDKLILVSDAISMAGAPPGLYQHGDAIAQMTPSGRFGFYRSPILIGAAVPLARCLANMASFVDEDKTPADYISHATQVPGTLMNIPHLARPLGSPGTPATFVVWRWKRDAPDLIPQRIVIRGRTIYDAETLPVEVPFGRTAKPVAPEQIGAHP
ncbi:MAG: N-acetylglucosamine-6-phosphate deacetylase [Anaerolineae bacterium]|nr:N-acetylglucosamine-6-phosphate deacetylase [Anaerolineae bacterium]